MQTSDDGWVQRRSPEPYSPSAEDSYLDDDLAETDGPDWQDLMLAISTLTEKQRFVIEMRFGLRDGYRYTLEDIARLMGIARKNVWALEQRALEMLNFVLEPHKPG